MCLTLENNVDEETDQSSDTAQCSVSLCIIDVSHFLLHDNNAS
jgi:hypothetical protein